MSRDGVYRDLVKEISEHLRSRARFSLPSDLQIVADRFVNHHISEAQRTILEGETLYRARINPNKIYSPLPEKELRAPPPEKSRNGRISSAGIPCLYTSTGLETAVHEVRPWIGAFVSVGEFKAKKDIMAVDLYNHESPMKYYENTDEHAEKRHAAFQGNAIKHGCFLTPRHEEDELSYLASQYLSEMFRAKGVGAVAYGSVMLEGGINVAFFNQDELYFVTASCHRIYKSEYSFNLVESR